MHSPPPPLHRLFRATAGLVAILLAGLILAACSGIGSHCDVIVHDRFTDPGCRATWVCGDTTYDVECIPAGGSAPRNALLCRASEECEPGSNERFQWADCDKDTCTDPDQIADVCEDALNEELPF